MEGNVGIQDIVARRGIYYQAFGIYHEVGGFFDYGPVGVRIRRNIESAWRNVFVEQLGAVEIETTTIMPEQVFKASGHLSTFADPITKCLKCGTHYRADKLLEEYYEKKGESKKEEEIKKLDIEQLDAEIRKNDIKCEKCGGELSKVERFNLMFQTQIGPLTTDKGYLRPETAQGMFVDFKYLFRISGAKLPMVVAQVGKVYRNEISPRQQLVRLREFSQMETELFFDPEEMPSEVGEISVNAILDTRLNFEEAGKEEVRERSIGELLEAGKIPNKMLALLIYLEKRLVDTLGIPAELCRFRELEKEELPHYSKGNIDLEVKTSYGYIEIAGNAYRTDYDLSSHAKLSGTDLSVTSGSKKIVPHVAEASIGIDRTLFALLDSSLKTGDRDWAWLRLSSVAAPYQYAIFPLQKDEKLEAKAREIYKKLAARGLQTYYSSSGSIGKRYARADEIGVPSCITIDYQTLEDGTVTVRNRDTMKQERVEEGKL
ncbi:MAG: glycine--tRNA ligase [Candidatus Micrarchaeia archaeon]